MSHFSEAQLIELETIYGLVRVGKTLPVRDGSVTERSTVWWRSEYGPQEVNAIEHWDNIKHFPDVYQVSKPKGEASFTYYED